jgi:UDP-2,4-diacetamido-2,4,6-trideoxy-beta-L-altropyranose hydrolase
MRVVFLTEGGEGIGWGHVSRCSAIAQAFEEKGHSTQLIVDGSSGAETAGLGHFAISGKWTAGTGAIKQLLRHADAAVVDSYKASEAIYAEIGSQVRLEVCLDDTYRLDYPASIVINSSVNLQQTRRDYFLKSEFLFGPHYAPLRGPFWDMQEKEIRPLPRTVLVYMSENDPRNLCGLAVDSLMRTIGDCQIACIAGGNACNGVKVLNGLTAEDIKSLMIDADLAVVAGGQIIYELARVGVPTVAIGIAENQRPNIEGWQQRGFIEFAGWSNEDDLPRRLEDCIAALQGHAERAKRAIVGTSIIDGQGARRIRDRMLEWS